MSQEITKQEPTDLAIFQGADSGFEGTNSETFKTPFMKILQSLSPECKKKDPNYMEEAIEGDFCNSASRDLHKELNVVILKVEHVLVVWKPDRGGFVGRYDKSEESKVVFERDGVKKWDENGNNVMDTIEFYCMRIEDPTDIFILSLSTTSLKYGQSFATRLRMLKVQNKPIGVSWAAVWNIKTIEETNDKGSWYTIGKTPSFVRFITAEEKEKFILPAKEMLIKAEVDYSTIESTASTDTGTGEDVAF